MADTAGRELRIALSMRGGVSLAVWIGGAAREIDALTRHEADDWDSNPENWYAALLKLGGYERATIDVITGASAGGLNGVVLAASRVYGFPFHRMLPLWVEVADIELMSRDPLEKETDEETGRPTRRPASLMQGNEYFLDRLQTQLRALVADGSDRDVVDQPFQLILSATLVNPSVQVTDQDPFSPMPEIRRDASFRFRYLGHDGGDFQERGQASGAEPSSTVSLLALAGRATSSFPVAFEPASVTNVAADVFSDPPSGSATQRVIDGGVLDNIPVSKAIEAIADAPPSPQAERWLVFLHPSPGMRPAEPVPTERRASPQALATLAVTVGAAFSQESLLDDLDELERYNAEAARLRLRRRAALAEIHRDGLTAAMMADFASQRFGTSRAVRAQSEAVRTVRLLRGDLVVSGTQIRPHPSLSARVRARGSSVVTESEAHYSDQFVSSEALCRSVGGLGLATELVGEWFGRLDPAALPAGVAEEVARRLGRLKRLVRVVRRRSDRSWLYRAVVNVDPSEAWLSGGVEHAVTAARFGIVSGDVDAVAFRNAVAGADGEDFDAALDVLDTVPATPSIGPNLDLATIVWELLVAVLVQLRPFGEGRAGEPDADVLDLGFGDPSRDAARFDVVLEALVVVLTQAQTSGQTSDAEVRFMRISAANASPLAARFLPTTAGQAQPPLTAADKLCGNELANFSAFLSARWRANDWMWGRMDAAKSLVDLTIRPARIAASGLAVSEMIEIISRLVSDSGLTLEGERLAEVSAELTGVAAAASADEATGLTATRAVVTEAVQRRIFAEMEPVISALGESPWWPGLAVPGGLGTGSAATPSPPVAPETPLDERMAAYRVGRETLADLGSRRRTQIGMRLALVGYGALKPLKRKAPSRIARLVMAATKPFLLFAAFAALNVARATFLVTMTLAGFWVGPWRYRGSQGHGPAELLTYRELPWGAGEWWPEQMVPGGWLAWVGVAVIALLSLYCLLRAARLLVGQRAAAITANKRRRDIGWYAAGGLLAPAVVVASMATGVATGPVLVAVLAGGVGALTCRWMKPGATVAIGVLVTATYVAVGGAFGILVLISDRAWFSFTLWMSVVALYSAQLVIALFCTFAQVLPDEEEILRQARRRAASASSAR